MSVAAKMRHTNIIIGDRHPKVFSVPADKAKSLLVLLSDYRNEDEEPVSADEALRHIYAETSKGATHLRGARLRDGFTQVQLAKKLGTTQAAIANMEAGKRPISKAMAQKLAKIFDTDHRAFL